MTSFERWPFIKAYGQLMGFTNAHICEEYVRAEETQPPRDAYASRYFQGWFTLSDHPYGTMLKTRERLEVAVGISAEDILKEKANG